jgi:hypothetical protein
MRQPALKVISIIAYDPNMSYRVIPDLITVLEASGGTATLAKETLSMRKDILAALCYIFVNNSVAKEAFRLKGGFVWTVSILDGIGKCIGDFTPPSEHPEEYERTFHFLCVLLKMLSVALKRNAQNIEYFRREIQVQHRKTEPGRDRNSLPSLGVLYCGRDVPEDSFSRSTAESPRADRFSARPR